MRTQSISKPQSTSKRRPHSRGEIALLLTLGLGAALVSCRALKSESEGLSIRIDGGKISMSSNGNRCAKVTFVGDGGQLGCEVHHLPADGICPPPGTRRAHAELVRCPPGGHRPIDYVTGGIPGPLPGSPPAWSAGPAGGGVQQLESFRFFGTPVSLEAGEPFVEYDFEIRARNRQHARLIRDRILDEAHLGLAGFQNWGTSVVVVHHLVHAQLVDDRVHFTLFDTKGIAELSLDVNGTKNYRDLDDAVTLSRNGWQLVGLAVNLTDLNWGILPGMEYENRYRLERRNVGSDEVRVLEGAWAYTP